MNTKNSQPIIDLPVDTTTTTTAATTTTTTTMTETHDSLYQKQLTISPEVVFIWVLPLNWRTCSVVLFLRYRRGCLTNVSIFPFAFDRLSII